MIFFYVLLDVVVSLVPVKGCCSDSPECTSTLHSLNLLSMWRQGKLTVPKSPIPFFPCNEFSYVH